MDNRLEVSVAEFITVRFQLCASKFEGGAPRVSVAEFITVRFQPGFGEVSIEASSQFQ